MASFVPGQRWISDTEIEQGVGMLLTFDVRTVTLLYPATGETRIYRQKDCPLTRIRFEPGDTVASHEGWTITVKEVAEENGLIVYTGVNGQGQTLALPEAELDSLIELNVPHDRLLVGKIDLAKNFTLRYRTQLHYHRQCRSPWLGLSGPRVGLIAHQFHIAHEVADRHAPRVLLADEVGLGKTVEAGLVISRQLLTGRIARVLIVVPEPLVHQWLVEMLRRFNLKVSVFDQERCQTCSTNPFTDEQLALVSLDFIRDHENYREQALSAGWDMLVVDEAHHLQWSEAEGASADYAVIEQLASAIPSVLLLTATPEQSGHESHFARLRLLDPDRFYSLESFVQEERDYEPVAAAATELLDCGNVSPCAATNLRAWLGPEADPLVACINDDSVAAPQRQQAREQLIRTLLDRHGTSRILFRNTRAGVTGFPGRVVQAYPQELPELYSIALEGVEDADLHLYPELAYQKNIDLEDKDPWWRVDPRIEWLIELLRVLRNRKVLVICAHGGTAMDLETNLRVMAGIHAAVFHEQMTIVARDQAAAWFAEEGGADVLICSEIGSEGRNFQFSHHLVLFDLPKHPDLLEQRIGRLDRIGQQEVVRLHVPCFADSAQQRLFNWYNDGLNCFVAPCPAGSVVYSEYREELTAWLTAPPGTADTENGSAANDVADTVGSSLLERSRYSCEQTNRHIRLGRDRLLEINSNGSARTGCVTEAIAAQQGDDELPAYFDTLLDSFGMETEYHSEHALIVRPGAQMTVANYPGVPGDGTTITFGRETALIREDLQFVTWEHPMVRQGMDMLLSGDLGKTACCTLKSRGVKAGKMFMEAIFVVEAVGPPSLQLSKFLPPTVLRILLDPTLNNLADKVSFDAFNAQLNHLKTSMAAKVVRAQKNEITRMVQAAQNLACQQAGDIIREACNALMAYVTEEVRRLAALKAVNPNVRDGEIEFFRRQAEQGNAALQKAQMRMDAIRLVFTV